MEPQDFQYASLSSLDSLPNKVKTKNYKRTKTPHQEPQEPLKNQGDKSGCLNATRINLISSKILSRMKEEHNKILTYSDLCPKRILGALYIELQQVIK